MTEKNTTDALLHRIANHLIMNASFLDDLGLYHGKMGIVLFFAHYARYSKNPLYEEVAYSLLNELYEKINSQVSFDFESGFSGIGWGISYLLKYHLVEGNADDVLQQIDEKIMEWNLRYVKDTSLDTGIKGVSMYILDRLQYERSKDAVLPFDLFYVEEWEDCLRRLQIIIPSEYQFFNYILKLFPIQEDISIYNLGLKEGLAGVGLYYCLETDKCNVNNTSYLMN